VPRAPANRRLVAAQDGGGQEGYAALNQTLSGKRPFPRCRSAQSAGGGKAGPDPGAFRYKYHSGLHLGRLCLPSIL